MPTGTRRTGEFCWINMITPQPDEAREFFGTLLGWTFREMPGVGHGVKVGGHDIGGLFDQNGPNTPAGTRAHIGVMVKVDSADAATERVASLGGTGKPAFDIMNAGRMAVCYDPNGGEFDVWETKRMGGTAVDSTQHGAPSWFETMTTDVDCAATFYSELFGWTPRTMPVAGTDYTTFSLGDVPVAGMMQITPCDDETGAMRPHWATYFTVTNADATAAEADALGATLVVPVQDIPGVGRFCGISSPQGVMFFVIEYTS
jgi:hypothetical protein